MLFRSSGGGNLTDFTVYSDASEFTGSIKTAAPSGYTAQPWKFGDVTDTSITLNSQYISVEINGVVYNIPTCHPN